MTSKDLKQQAEERDRNVSIETSDLPISRWREWSSRRLTEKRDTHKDVLAFAEA